jgi:hypothetical protein
MASEVSIINRALIKLGAGTILLRTDNSAEARAMNAIFEDTRDAELRSHRWKFSIKRTTLSALVASPAWGYTYQYPLPADYLGMVQVNEYYVRTGTKQRAPWSVESNLILTELPAPLQLRYISRVTDTVQFDALFVDALACRLAMEACEILTQSDTKFQRVASMYKQSISEALRVDSIENPPDELPYGTWLGSREGASDFVVGPDGIAVQLPSGIEVL